MNIFLKEEKMNKEIIVEKDLDVFLIGTSGGELDLKINLVNPGVQANIYGILIGCKHQSYKVNTLSHHKKQETKSRVHIKGVFMDDSSLEYEGMIKIDYGAQLSDAYLKNDNLVIGDNAVINTSPQLEIEADDVSASHGVTISTIDELQEYYLQSRGLDKVLSTDLLVKGFVQDILAKSGDNIEVKVPAILKNEK